MLKEYIESLFVELFESRVRDILDGAQLRASIQDYVDSQRRVFESCIPDEELDYEGLTQYLRDEILSEIELRIFAPSRDERGRAYASVYSKAIAYAHANTKLQKANVRKFVNAVLDILNNFYEQKITPLQRYMRTVTVDAMLAGTEKQHEVQTQDVIMGVQQVLRTEMIRNPLSIDENVALMQAGNITQVEDNLALLQRTISATHVLAPDYGFIMRRVGGKEHLVSTPLTDDAHRLHPPLFKIQGQVYIGTEAAPSLTQDLVKYADDHQLPITIDIEDAHKYLGDIVDPIQIEAEELRGHKLVRQPKPFPEAQAYCVVIDGVVVCETLYLRIAEKNEDGTIVYSNQGNPYPFSIRFTVDPLQASTEFSFSYEGKDHTMHLFYYEFLKSYHAGQRISFRNLETGDAL